MQNAVYDLFRSPTQFLSLSTENVPEMEASNLQLSLSDLCCLSGYPQVEKLWITGGLPTQEGFDTLYRCRQLKVLLLDYEETDSDETGIDLSRFPDLCYVRTRSDFNIRGIDAYLAEEKIQLEACNEYRGRHRKIRLPDGIPILPYYHTIFFSVEAETPAGR